MELMLALLIGLLFTVGVYLLLRRSILKLALGIIFIGNAINLIIFVASGLVAGKPSFVTGQEPEQAMADPLPQALILTAIVISFGIVVFTLALKYKYFTLTNSDDFDQLTEMEDE